MTSFPSINILGVNVNKLTYETFLHFIKKAVSGNVKISIAYANADTLNKIKSDKNLKSIYNSFDIIHPDGVGVYLASRFLYGKRGLRKRITGSDFYEILISQSLKSGWKYFFFGHTNEILNRISLNHPELNIKGYSEGYNFKTPEVISEINKVNPDIIIIGLSCPVQEKWMYENRDKINFKVMLAVGDGIKVFAGNRIRGPVVFRKAGMEWIIRLILNPFTNFRKYVIGIPLFIFRVTAQKLKSK